MEKFKKDENKQNRLSASNKDFWVFKRLLGSEKVVCVWCKNNRTYSEGIYEIYKRMDAGFNDILVGHICCSCACSAEQALVLWGEDGSLF